METAASLVLKRVWLFTVEILRRQTIASIEVGDVELEKFRNTLLTEFEKVNEKLDLLIHQSLKTAMSLVNSALLAFAYQNFETATGFFREANIESRKAFAVVPKFEDKCCATSIRILCTLFLGGYFTPPITTDIAMIATPTIIQSSELTETTVPTIFSFITTYFTSADNDSDISSNIISNPSIKSSIPPQAVQCQPPQQRIEERCYSLQSNSPSMCSTEQLHFMKAECSQAMQELTESAHVTTSILAEVDGRNTLHMMVGTNSRSKRRQILQDLSCVNNILEKYLQIRYQIPHPITHLPIKWYAKSSRELIKFKNFTYPVRDGFFVDAQQGYLYIALDDSQAGYMIKLAYGIQIWDIQQHPPIEKCKLPIKNVCSLSAYDRFVYVQSSYQKIDKTSSIGYEILYQLQKWDIDTKQCLFTYLIPKAQNWIYEQAVHSSGNFFYIYLSDKQKLQLCTPESTEPTLLRDFSKERLEVFALKVVHDVLVVRLIVPHDDAEQRKGQVLLINPITCTDIRRIDDLTISPLDGILPPYWIGFDSEWNERKGEIVVKPFELLNDHVTFPIVGRLPMKEYSYVCGIYAKKLYVGERDGTLIIWDLTTMQQLDVLPGFHSDEINGLAIYQNRMYTASHSGSIKETLIDV